MPEKIDSVDAHYIMSILNDVNMFYDQIISLFDKIKPLLQVNLEIVEKIKIVLVSVLDKLPTLKIQEVVLESASNQCSQIFSNVISIPAQYRRTNKPTPEIPSFFMNGIFKPLQEFIEKCPKRISKDIKDEWVAKIAFKVIDKYSNTVQKTLASVKAIEDSLKRYKKSKSPEGVSDEYKIRYQFKLDVDHLIAQVLNNNKAQENKISFQELLNLKTLVQESLE